MFNIFLHINNLPLLDNHFLNFNDFISLSNPYFLSKGKSYWNIPTF